jgi:hypothetical protein
MSATFSINIGTIIESTRKADIFGALSDIQDNTQKLISPKDVRDAILTTWSNTPFKVTIPNSLSGFEYIGIDSSNPNNRDIKQKILLGKRSYGGLDIMSNNLINSDTDIFIYNTKIDSLSQSSTKVSILAGTDSTLYSYAPYIESYSSLNKIDLNVVNPSSNGGINILSQTGRVSINGVIFPTIAETAATASDGMILRYHGTYPKGQFKWEIPTISYTVIGSDDYPTEIVGSPVNVNGYSLEFVDTNLVTATMGGIPLGFSFSENSFANDQGGFQNWPVTEVLRKLLYPYTLPFYELESTNVVTNTIYAEVGKVSPIRLDYHMITYAKGGTSDTAYYKITDDANAIIPGGTGSFPIGTSVQSNLTITSTSNVIADKNWTLSLSDSGLTQSFSYSITTTVHFINPIIYGFTTSTTVNVSTGLSKSIQPYPGADNSVTLSYDGKGYLHFMYDTTFAPLKMIKDPNGFIIFDVDYPQYSAFTQSTGAITDYSSNGSFIKWRTKEICSYPGGDFKFIF